MFGENLKLTFACIENHFMVNYETNLTVLIARFFFILWSFNIGRIPFLGLSWKGNIYICVVWQIHALVYSLMQVDLMQQTWVLYLPSSEWVDLCFWEVKTNTSSCTSWILRLQVFRFLNTIWTWLAVRFCLVIWD